MLQKNKDFAKDLMRYGKVVSRKDYVMPSGWLTIREIEYKDSKYILKMRNGEVMTIEGVKRNERSVDM